MKKTTIALLEFPLVFTLMLVGRGSQEDGNTKEAEPEEKTKIVSTI